MWSPFNNAQRKKLEEKLVVAVSSAQTSAQSFEEAMRELEDAIAHIRWKQNAK